MGDTRLGDHRKVEAIKSIKKSNQLTEDDMWVEHLGNVAMSDTDYLTMIHHIEAVNSAGYTIIRTDYQYIH